MITLNRWSLRKAVAHLLAVTNHADRAMTSRSLPLRAPVMAALLLASLTAATRETKLGSIGFDLPKDWRVQMDGTDRLIASPTGATDSPPFVMAEFCFANSGQPCPPAEAPNAEKTGCIDPQLSSKQWSHGVGEKRWICPRVASAAGVFNLAVGHFLAPTWTLRVVYIFTDKDQPPNKFLDALGKTLRKE